MAQKAPAPTRRRPRRHGRGSTADPRARPVGPDHAVDLRPRRAGRAVPRPHQPRQQPRLLRDHRQPPIPAPNSRCPPYGCCCLGSIDLTRFVRAPSRPTRPRSTRPPSSRGGAWRRACSTTCSTSPSGRCRSSSRRRATSAASASASPAGRRAGDAGLRYDTEARAMAAASAETMRDAAYRASVDLAASAVLPAVQRRPLPERGTFASRLPRRLRRRIRAARPAQLAPAVHRAHRHHQPGLRRQRQQRHRAGLQLDLHAQEAHARRQLQRIYAVEDHAWRLYRHLKGGDAPLTSLRHRAGDERQAHEAMVAAVAPLVDTAISKTVNVPADYPYADFQAPVPEAWKSGLKGLATYRPNAVLGSVLSTRPGGEPPCRSPPRPRSTTPTAAWRSTACPRRCWPRCAGRAPRAAGTATRPGPS